MPINLKDPNLATALDELDRVDSEIYKVRRAICAYPEPSNFNELEKRLHDLQTKSHKLYQSIGLAIN